MTLRNCRIDERVHFSGDNMRLKHCEIVGGLTLSGNNIHVISEDGMHVTSDTGQVRNVSMSHNFVHGYVYPGSIACLGPHSDGIQVRGADGLTLYNNVFDMGPWQVICAGHFTPLNGGAIVVRLGPGPNTRLIDNWFGRDERYSLIQDETATADQAVISGNVRDDDGSPVRP